jgi:hypothetical protein
MTSVPALLRTPLLALAGIALGLALTLVVLRMVPDRELTEPAPQSLAGQPLLEDDGPLEEVLFHYVPKLEPLLRDPYQDFLGTLHPTTRLVAVVPDESGIQSRLRAFLAQIDSTESLWKRTRVVVVPGPISPWSKDRALVMSPPAGESRSLLLVPEPPALKWRERRNDWRTVQLVASAMPHRYLVHQLPLELDAGDFAVTRRAVLVDVNLVDKNRDRGITSPTELKRLLKAKLGRDVVVLGQRTGDVPRHHMSMYMAPLGRSQGRDVVLVGDLGLARPIVGGDFVPGELSADTGKPLKADFSAEMAARHDRAAQALTAAGFEVVRIPTVAFDDKTYLAYTNGVYATRGGARIAWVPRYGIEPLDELAFATYRKLGWEVRPVSVRKVYPYHGTIGCLVNVLSRSPRRS